MNKIFWRFYQYEKAMLAPCDLLGFKALDIETGKIFLSLPFGLYWMHRDLNAAVMKRRK